MNQGSMRTVFKHPNSLKPTAEMEEVENMSSSSHSRQKREFAKQTGVQKVSPRDKVKRDLRKKQIFDAIYNNASMSINDLDQSAKTSSSLQVSSQCISPQMAAYCHNSPLTQLLKDRQPSLRKALKTEDKEAECHKMTFEQFARLPFDADVPQLVEDLF